MLGARDGWNFNLPCTQVKLYNAARVLIYFRSGEWCLPQRYMHTPAVLLLFCLRKDRVAGNSACGGCSMCPLWKQELDRISIKLHPLQEIKSIKKKFTVKYGSLSLYRASIFLFCFFTITNCFKESYKNFPSKYLVEHLSTGIIVQSSTAMAQHQKIQFKLFDCCTAAMFYPFVKLFYLIVHFSSKLSQDKFVASTKCPIYLEKEKEQKKTKTKPNIKMICLLLWRTRHLANLVVHLVYSRKEKIPTPDRRL